VATMFVATNCRRGRPRKSAPADSGLAVAVADVEAVTEGTALRSRCANAFSSLVDDLARLSDIGEDAAAEHPARPLAVREMKRIRFCASSAHA
jgi:hypothetical protein